MSMLWTVLTLREMVKKFLVVVLVVVVVVIFNKMVGSTTSH